MKNALKFNAAEVARGLEFCGFGPAAMDSSLTVRVHARDVHFVLSMRKDGTLHDFEPLWGYQNTLHPTVRAVLNIISHVFVQLSGTPFLEAQVEDDFDTSGKIVLRATLLWQSNPEEADPFKRRRYVLQELIIGGDAVWCSLETMPYATTHYQAFYDHGRNMIIDFRDHGKLPANVTLEQINDVLELCVAEAP